MNKLLALILSAVMLLSAAPGHSRGNPTFATGGWTIPEGDALSEEARSVFEKAVGGLTNVRFEPLALLGTQEVSGRNYCFLCRVEDGTSASVSEYRYGVAQENRVYRGYAIEGGAEVEMAAQTSMNTYIRQMLDANNPNSLILGLEYYYLVEQQTPDIYLLSQVDHSEVAAFGQGKYKIGTYNMAAGTLSFTGAEVAGLSEAARTIRGDTSLVLDGVTYLFEKNRNPKSYDVFVLLDGLRYTGEALGPEFEASLYAAMQSGSPGFWLGAGDDVDLYCIVSKGTWSSIHRIDEKKPAMLYTSLSLSTCAPDLALPEAFTAAALQAALGYGKFTFNDKSYSTLAQEDGLLIRDARGQDFARLSSLVIRRYNGEDTVPYELKQQIASAIREPGTKEASFYYDLPLQSPNGSYVLAPDGHALIEETELWLEKQLTGEYVIWARQALPESPSEPFYVLVYIYADLQGNVGITGLIPLDIAGLSQSAAAGFSV